MIFLTDDHFKENVTEILPHHRLHHLHTMFSFQTQTVVFGKYSQHAKKVFLKRYYKVVGQFHSREMLRRIMNRYYIYKEFNNTEMEFPGSPVVMIWCFHCRALGSILGQGTEIPQAAQHGQKKRKNSMGKMS